MSLIDIKKDVFSATDTGLVRKANEDNCGAAETPNGYLLTVCDGMGGHVGGAQASRIGVDCIIQYLSKEAYTDVQQALADALDFANLQIIGTAAEHPELSGMGTTACVVLVQDDCVWLAHAGDSRIYLYVAKEKRLHRLTKDHSYVQGLVDQGMITDAEAETHPNKNRILKALGVSEDLRPEVAPQAVLPAKGDIFLICSDGLSGMVSDQQMEEVLSDKTGMEQKKIALMSLAKSAGGKDNITFQMVRISNSPYKKSVFESKNPGTGKVATIGTGKWKKYAGIAAVAVLGIALGGWLGYRFAPQPPANTNITEEDSTQVQQTTDTNDTSKIHTTESSTVVETHTNTASVNTGKNNEKSGKEQETVQLPPTVDGKEAGGQDEAKTDSVKNTAATDNEHK